MPQLTSYALSFQGGLHIGTRGVTLEEAGVSIPSDTLFSALLHSWMLAGGDIEEFVAAFKTPSNAPFLLTSAFPFAGDVRFYPMPKDLTRLFLEGTLKDEERGKSLKHIQYFSEALLQIALKGKKLDELLFPKNEKDMQSKGLGLQGGTLWLSPDEVSKLPEDFRKAKNPKPVLPLLKVWKEARAPRVTIERITNATNIYQAGRVQFAKDCGLWFGVDWRKPDATLRDGLNYKPAFEKALAVLEDEGLGGERSSGYGAFSSKLMDTSFEYNEPKSDGAAYLLSRYIPNQSELPDALTSERAAYELVSLGGWLQTYSGASQRRKRQMMVTAGSLVSAKNYPAGCIVNLKPDYDAKAGDLGHAVYRSGLALAVNWPK